MGRRCINITGREYVSPVDERPPAEIGGARPGEGAAVAEQGQEGELPRLGRLAADHKV
jgi:hypothetical protein